MGATCKNDKDLTATSCLEKPQEFSSQLKREKCPWGMRNGAQSGLNVECKGRSPQRAEKPCVETQVPTRRAWRSGTHDFLYYFFSYQRKYPSISTLLWRASICVLSTNHLLIQWDCEVGCCQHIHLSTKAICRGDAKLQCLEVNLLAFQDKHLFGYNYWNLNPKMGGKSRPR